MHDATDSRFQRDDIGRRFSRLDGSLPVQAFRDCVRMMDFGAVLCYYGRPPFLQFTVLVGLDAGRDYPFV